MRGILDIWQNIDRDTVLDNCCKIIRGILDIWHNHERDIGDIVSMAQ
jgi:hypothetical protein